MNEEEIKESLDKIIETIESEKKHNESHNELEEMYATLFGKEYTPKNTIAIDIFVKDIKVFESLVKTEQYKYVSKITLKIHDFTSLSDEDIELISSSHANIELKADNIRGASPEVISRLGNIHYKIEFDNYSDKNPYTAEQMQKMLEIIDSFKGQILGKPSEFEKFMEIYKILILSNDYDFTGNVSNEKSTEEKATITRSLIGAILYGSVVCHGFSLELKQMLAYYGIESKFITGSKHAWNQVKIDGKWYNTDLTTDYNVNRRMDKNKLPCCLLGDENFYGKIFPEDGQLCEIPEKCPFDFPRDKINEHLQDLINRKSFKPNDLGKGLVTLSQLREIAYSTYVEPEFIDELREAKTQSPDIRKENEQDDERTN